MKYRFRQHESRKTISLPFLFLTVYQGNYVSITMKLTRDKFAEIHREGKTQASVVAKNRGESLR